MRIAHAATGLATAALFLGMSGFTFAPSDGPAGCDPNAPGSCDQYKGNDPYVNQQVNNAPPGHVIMSGFAFVPTSITGAPGQVFTEDNKDVATHNITTENLAEHPKNKDYTGGDIAPDVMQGQSHTFTLPKKPGTYKAVCFYHQDMHLTIIVK